MLKIKSPRARRSRQVRSARRRSYTRVVARGRSRDEALVEFHARGGKLAIDELQRLLALANSRLRVGGKSIDFKFGGVRVVHPETVKYIDEGPQPRLQVEFTVADRGLTSALTRAQASIEELSAAASGEADR